MRGAPAADFTDTVHSVANAIARALSDLSVLDWILIGLIFLAIAWGWIHARAFARLGTIEIQDLTADDDSLAPAAFRAQLQEALSKRGWLPASGVPNGAPTPASLAAAVADAPVAQAQWLGSLISLVPFPPTKTGFRVSGTLLAEPTAPDAQRRFGLSYQLVCTGPRHDVQLAEKRGGDWQEVIEEVAKDLYLRIARAAPEIYPAWARWAGPEALTEYRLGIDAENARPGAQNGQADNQAQVAPGAVTERYSQAYEHYRRASLLDPDNMLARLRAANCLERIAAGMADDPVGQEHTRLEALQAYMSIRRRQPTIFQAGFRASVLLSVLASGELHEGSELRKVRNLIARHPAAMRRGRVNGDREQMRRLLRDAGALESRMARSRLRPWGTLVREGRFRHRYELKTNERRQMIKALGMSRWAQRARRANEKAAGRAPGPLRELEHLLWRLWVRTVHMSLRSHLAGWSAHYNAACFYALLPEAAKRIELDPARIRRRALYHLRQAVKYCDGMLPCAYVRDEDLDLETLRKLSRHEFAAAIGPICPDVVTIHYVLGEDGQNWHLETWGEAIAPQNGHATRMDCRPVSSDSTEAVFRVRIFDENKPLFFVARRDDEADIMQWLIPAEFPPEVRVDPGDHFIHPHEADDDQLLVEVITIRYMPAGAVDGWMLHVWGDAVVPREGDWHRPLHPTPSSAATAVTFRVRLFDAKKRLHFILHNGHERDPHERSVTPAEIDGREVIVRAGSPAVLAVD